jgi:IS605 OrfB family transposase
MPNLSFNDIGNHEEVISRRASKMYRARRSNRDSRHAPRGGTTFKTFRRHVLKMKEDRYKKAAHLILEAAVSHRASVIVVENLENYRPDLERPARENRRRMRWNVQRIVEFLEQSAHPLGIRLWRVGPHWSSRFCSACGHPGARFSVPRKTAWGRFYERRHGPIRKAIVEPGGQFFVCSNPKCSRPTGKHNADGLPTGMINADVNAALNFPKILAGTFERPEGDRNSRTWRGQPLDWKVIQQACQQRLDAHFAKKKDLAQQTPW